MSNSFKKNLVQKSGRWMRDSWYKHYRRICKNILKRDVDDINLPLPNETVSHYDITDHIYRCEGNVDTCWCSKQGYTYCRIKKK